MSLDTIRKKLFLNVQRESDILLIISLEMLTSLTKQAM